MTLKTIALVNFIRGGKSSICRLLAEKLNTSILNFDPKRDSAFYNAINTVNIAENSIIRKKENSVEVETVDAISEYTSKSEYFVCDFGGRFDERLKDFESDIYILPTMDDFESISETIKATKYILKHNPAAKIIHVLNLAQCFNIEEKEEFRTGYAALISKNNLDHIPSLEMPRSKLVKKIVNEGIKENDVIGDNKSLRKGGYRNINNFIETLIKMIEKEIKK